MTSFIQLKSTLAVAAVLAFSAANAITVTKSEYSASKARISADWKADKAACASMTDNAKDICIEVAKGKQKVAMADLEYSRTGKPADQSKAQMVRAETAYAVAKEKCDDKSGNDKSLCVKEAKAIETKALADAKMGKQISAAKMDAAEDKRDADYSVAAQKCDAMIGDAKSSCMAAAKVKFGKS